jgi:excisionase family DNA binding protein
MRNLKETDSETFSVAQARALIGPEQISTATIYNAIARGDIPVLRLGRRVLIPRAWLLDKLASGNSGAHK